MPPNPQKATPKKLVIRDKPPPPPPPSDTSSEELSTTDDESPIDPHSPPRRIPKPAPRKQPPAHQSRPSLTRIHSAPPVPGTSRASIASIQTFDSQDTQASIRDDPFFRSYQSPQSVRYAKETSARQAMEASARPLDSVVGRQSRRGSETTIKAEDKQRKPSVSETSQEYFPEADVHASMREINIVVVGAAGVGKSTFIQRAHDLRVPPKSAVSVRSLTVYGIVHGIRMIEMEFTDNLLTEDRHIVWPKRVDREILPPIDGVLALYDVMNEDSIARFPDLLEALHQSNLPTLLVSCKCDIPISSRQIDPNVIEHVGATLGGFEAFQTSGNVPETQKKCLGHMLRMIVQRRKDFPRQAARRRANSSANGRAVSPTTQGHARRGSETSTMMGRQPPEQRDPRQAGRRGSATDQNPTPSYDKGLAVVSELPFKSSDGTKGVFSFLDMGEERDDFRDEEGEDMPIPDDESLAEMPIKNPGQSWDELVDRLVAQPLTKADKNFVTVFLALYRKFAAPGDLLEAIISRFSKISSDDNPHLIKMTSQLRYLDVLTIWLQQYPGDFSFPRTRNKLKQFTEHIASNRVFAVAAKEMRANLEVNVEDEDAVWGKTDADKYRSIATALTARRQGSDEEIVEKRASDTSTSTLPAHSRSSSQALLNQQDSPILNGRLAVTKDQFKSFMEVPDEEIAGELTRLDWAIFSTFRPRDIVRHVSMSADQRAGNRSREPVDRITRQFNHTAYVVSHMVLLRDKPKHRAAILEKFMRIAKRLRTMNNYNSLGAVIAGIKSNSVHRLSHTKELVAQPILREFMKWEILMGTQKSHFAYRLAWENSTGERIPFIPLLKRDLTTTDAGNRTFIGAGEEKINWKKFEIMGEVILGVQRSQQMPYQDLPRNPEIEKLILDNSFSADDDELMSRFQELHERSVSLEGSGGVLNDPSGKKKFPWRWNQN